MATKDLRVVVETLTGGAFHLEIDPGEKVVVVKETLCHIQGIPVSHQQLVWMSIVLEDDMTLREYGFVKANARFIGLRETTNRRIRDGDTLQLVLQLRGGPLSTTADDDYASYPELDIPDTPFREALRQEYEEFAEISESDPGQVTLVIFNEDGTYEIVGVLPDDYLSALEQHVEPEPIPVEDIFSSPEATKRMFERARDNIQLRTNMKQLRSKMQKRSSRLKTLFPSAQPADASKSPTRQADPPRSARPSTAIKQAMVSDERYLPLPQIPSSRMPPLMPPHIPSLTGNLNLLQAIRRELATENSLTGDQISPHSTAGCHLPSIFAKLDLGGSGTAGADNERARPDLRPISTQKERKNSKKNPLFSSHTGASAERMPSARRRSDKCMAAEIQNFDVRLQMFVAIPSCKELCLQLEPKRKIRCGVCRKKLGLANNYSCKCQGIFCAEHRHAESHTCAFDYKKSGRTMLAANNPVVSAPKLPKI